MPYQIKVFTLRRNRPRSESWPYFIPGYANHVVTKHRMIHSILDATYLLHESFSYALRDQSGVDGCAIIVSNIQEPLLLDWSSHRETCHASFDAIRAHSDAFAPRADTMGSLPSRQAPSQTPPEIH